MMDSDEYLDDLPGETPKERAVRKVLTGQKSEFGHGVLIPLIYWAKHFENDRLVRARGAAEWLKLGKPPIQTIQAKYGPEMVQAVTEFRVFLNIAKACPAEGQTTEENAMAQILWHWANGASDHLYGLQTSSKFSDGLNKKITELQDKALSIGHGHDLQRRVTLDDIDRLWELTKEVALEVDRTVCGIEDADEGRYD